LIPDIEKFLQFLESIQDIIIYPHIKFWWYRTMLNFCDIVAVILKMATSKNCSMSGLNSGHPTLNNFYRSPFSKCITKIQHCPISSQFDMWVDNDVLNWFPTLKIDRWVDNDVKNWFSTLNNRINSGHHYLPTYQIVMISVNVEFLRYCDGHFENGDC
jgi:hypothetical protein